MRPGISYLIINEIQACLESGVVDQEEFNHNIVAIILVTLANECVKPIKDRNRAYLKGVVSTGCAERMLRGKLWLQLAPKEL
jgi:hypothetical protein